jgi:hypothetical protein
MVMREWSVGDALFDLIRQRKIWLGERDWTRTDGQALHEYAARRNLSLLRHESQMYFVTMRNRWFIANKCLSKQQFIPLG